ncbi:hypothetical protein [Sphingomonas sp.]|uniref:hypothetical protein n=1 Tax=Sphingomonas sp. TaxID=28214 RepID=UPI0035BC23D5
MPTASNAHAVPQSLVQKIGELPRGRVAEVEDFVDFLSLRERETSDAALRRAAMSASASSLAAIWNNPEDDVYDAL